jgi:hypothetical protein
MFDPVTLNTRFYTVCGMFPRLSRGWLRVHYSRRGLDLLLAALAVLVLLGKS